MLGRWERCMSGVRWQGGRIVSWHSQRGGKIMSWKFGKDEGGGGLVRWQGGRFPVLFNSGGRRVRPRFHLFVSDANQRNEGA